MIDEFTGEDFETLDIFEEILEVSDNIYSDSPFLPLKVLSSRTKGAKFEAIAEEILKKNGHDVQKPAKSTSYDRLVDGSKVEIKGSFLWGKNGLQGFRWQQIRPSQDYDYILFMAVYPNKISLYAADKN